MLDPITCLIYGAPSALLFVGYLRRRSRLERRSAEAHELAQSMGLKEPPSLHPLVDPARCIGCGTCVKVCPEQPEHHVLGIIGGRAELVSPADCIGHGACRAACPVEAITLVFGTERRGVEIPLLSARFETTVPGIFVAGELGGMGLIRNALEQGRQAVDAIHDSRGGGGAGSLDLVIVGAGPAGFAASLTAMSKRLRFITLEQESLGGCVFQYPRGKLVMTAPATVPIIGRVDLKRTSKEALLEFWRDVERRTGLEIRYGERVEDVARTAQGFIVKTPRGEYPTRSVLLAIGRRGTPRKLAVPGEELPKVVYRLIDPEQYRGRRVLVVGGGDSALEAATNLTEAGSSVALSYRGEAFDRAKPANRQRVQAAEDAGGLRVLLRSKVRRIEPGSVLMEQDGNALALHNDAVIVNAGGVLPADFLRRIGIHVETKYGTA